MIILCSCGNDSDRVLIMNNITWRSYNEDKGMISQWLSLYPGRVMILMKEWYWCYDGVSTHGRMMLILENRDTMNNREHIWNNKNDRWMRMMKRSADR